MRFAIDCVSKCSGRIGTFTNCSADIKLSTPLLLIYTKGASIPNISRDLVQYLTNETQILEISLSTIQHMEEALKVFGKGIAEFAGFVNYPTLVNLKDTLEPSKSGFHDKGSISLFNKRGRINVTPERFMNLMEVIRPTFYHTLCDGDTNVTSSKKRLIKSIERNEEFFKACIDRHRESKNLSNSVLIAPIEGGYDKDLRTKSIKFLQSFNEVGGFLIDGLHHNGVEAAFLNKDNVKQMIQHCIEQLPDDKPRFMLGAYNPLMIIEAVSLGVDVFDSTYPCIQAKHNLAITFNFDLDKDTNEPFQKDLSDKKYKEEFVPILNDCDCLGCSNHTQAYVHHLIETNELLAPMIITMHNLRHYMKFFEAIRKAILNDRLTDLKNLIENQISDEVIIKDAETKPSENLLK